MNMLLRQLGVGCLTGFLMLSVSGCVSPVSPRMPAVLGLSEELMDVTSNPSDHWAKYRTFGLVTVSDATGPEAAPAVSSTLLLTLTRRVEAYFEHQCGGIALKRFPMPDFHAGKGLISLRHVARQHDVEAVIIVIFSSTESMEAATFGEARMMTQMPGTTTYNTALVELALLDVAEGRLALRIVQTAVERLDRLNVPIGSDQGTREEALDILRAQAGQQALDRGLEGLTHGCPSA
ncbi:MAG: hypothetical protein NPIRA02_30240 [Nitrospirales bacterium]|nr:MAG: hypothetical protein NPIRA02_30240 [Nitrospirales bacterium]